MSKSQNPMTGNMSGSMANFATYKRFGKNIIRSKAFEPKDANTVSQKAQRASFKLIVKAYQSFGGITNMAFPKRAENQTPFNAFVAANLPEAINKAGQAPVIDYNLLTVSDGSIPVVIVTDATIGAAGITIGYKTPAKTPKVLASDEVIAFALLKSGEVITESKARGNQPISTILLPYADINAADVVCCYVFALNADGSNASKSTFVQV